MKLHRIKASLLHSWYHLNHSVETWIDLFWFSVIDICVFGYMAMYFSGNAQSTSFLIVGMILWQVMRVGQYTVSVGMLWEVWSKSFSSMFVSPLTIWEFFIGQILSGIIKSLGVLTLVNIIAMLLFDFSIVSLGAVVIVYFSLLFMFAVATGFFVNALILRFGTNIQSLAWGLIYLFQPISAIFYPLEVLPQSIRFIAYLSPITYVMESARQQLTTGRILWLELGMSFVLTTIYLLLATVFLQWMLQWSRKTGAFARMGS